MLAYTTHLSFLFFFFYFFIFLGVFTNCLFFKFGRIMTYKTKKQLPILATLHVWDILGYYFVKGPLTRAEMNGCLLSIVYSILFSELQFLNIGFHPIKHLMFFLSNSARYVLCQFVKLVNSIMNSSFQLVI